MFIRAEIGKKPRFRFNQMSDVGRITHVKWSRTVLSRTINNRLLPYVYQQPESANRKAVKLLNKKKRKTKLWHACVKDLF